MRGPRPPRADTRPHNTRGDVSGVSVTTSMKRERERERQRECEKNIKRERPTSGTRTRATRQNARDVRIQGTRSRNVRQGVLEDALPSKAIVEIAQNTPQDRVQQRASRKHVELDIMLAEHEMGIEEKLMDLKF